MNNKDYELATELYNATFRYVAKNSAGEIFAFQKKPHLIYGYDWKIIDGLKMKIDSKFFEDLASPDRIELETMLFNEMI